MAQVPGLYVSCVYPLFAVKFPMQFMPGGRDKPLQQSSVSYHQICFFLLKYTAVPDTTHVYHTVPCFCVSCFYYGISQLKSQVCKLNKQCCRHCYSQVAHLLHFSVNKLLPLVSSISVVPFQRDWEGCF